jgi:hypothetical protein
MSDLQYILERNNSKVNASILQEYGGISQKSQKDFFTFYLSFSNVGYFDSGFIPPKNSGLISIRKAGNHTQLAYQHEPGSYLVNWSWEESGSATVYNLAQPYRIVIMDFVDNSFYGSRHFYSPYPMASYHNVLYHTNFPNTNCKGYGNGLGVGWICLYHNEESSKLSTINDMLMVGLSRTSGTEAFNDNNMPETDGVRFYMQKKLGFSLDISDFISHEEYYDTSLDIHNYKNSFLWNPIVWQEKTESDGFSWILEDYLYSPVLVKGLDDQTAHYDNGTYLTLEMALKGSYMSYYSDPSPLKTYNKIDRIINRDNPIYNNITTEVDYSLLDNSILNTLHSSFANSPLVEQIQSKDLF